MSELSPQTQAVLDAYNAGFARPVAVHHKPRIAAALRAAADQLVLVQWDGRIKPAAPHSLGVNFSRDALHAIANELEAQ